MEIGWQGWLLLAYGVYLIWLLERRLDRLQERVDEILARMPADSDPEDY